MYFKYFSNILLFLVFFVNFLKSDIFAATKNHAIPLNSSQLPWRSIGLLKHNNKKCVAVVIDKNILLTSAYCLFEENGNKLSNIQDLSFKSGYKDRFYLLHTTISSYLTQNITYPPNNLFDIRNSWAFLFTNDNISNITGIIKLHREPITSEFLKNHKIITVGYNDQEENGLFASIKCTFNSSSIEFNNKSFIDTETAPILLQSCTDNFSPLLGSPVLSIDKDNNISLIGIVSGRLTDDKNNNEHINIVVPTTFLNNSFIDKLNKEEYNNESLKGALK